MNVYQAIEVINRRAATLKNLFGVSSDEYGKFTAQMSMYDTYGSTAKHAIQLNQNKNNRAFYRELIPWAKKIQKTPYSVLKRKADKKKKAFEDIFQSEDPNDVDIMDYNTYNEWLADIGSYFESCYVLASMNGYEGYMCYQYAAHLYDNRRDYVRQWNYFYSTGAFADYSAKYEESQFYQQYDVNTETGEVTEKEGFYQDFDTILE